MSILVVGSVAYDGIETPFDSVDRILGGSGTYISLAASYFSDNIRLVGVVGKDFADEDILKFQNKGIDLEGLKRDNSGKTFFWKGRYHFDLNSRDTLDTQLNVFETFNPIIPESYKQSNIVCLGNIEPGLQRKVLSQISKPDITIMDTMNFWIEGAKDSLLETLKLIDVLIINDSEARELAELPNLIKAAEKIKTMGPKILIIKKGEHGALLFTDNTLFAVPAYPVVNIFDPTGAGDTFLGGFAGWLDKAADYSDVNLKRAVTFGSVLASYCVEKFGPEQLLDLDHPEISERYNTFVEMSTIPDQLLNIDDYD